MAVYTAAELYGNGVQGEDISISMTFTFDNPSGSSYFTIETEQDRTGSFSGKQKTTSGSWTPSTAYMGPVQSDYFASVVVPPGASSVTLAPATAITGTNYRMKGTGAFSVTTSIDLIDAFKLRVSDDSGVFEAELCLNTILTNLNNI